MKQRDRLEEITLQELQCILEKTRQATLKLNDAATELVRILENNPRYINEIDAIQRGGQSHGKDIKKNTSGSD